MNFYYNTKSCTSSWHKELMDQKCFLHVCRKTYPKSLSVTKSSSYLGTKGLTATTRGKIRLFVSFPYKPTSFITIGKCNWIEFPSVRSAKVQDGIDREKLFQLNTGKMENRSFESFLCFPHMSVQEIVIIFPCLEGQLYINP